MDNYRYEIIHCIHNRINNSENRSGAVNIAFVNWIRSSSANKYSERNEVVKMLNGTVTLCTQSQENNLGADVNTTL